MEATTHTPGKFKDGNTSCLRTGHHSRQWKTASYPKSVDFGQESPSKFENEISITKIFFIVNHFLTDIWRLCTWSGPIKRKEHRSAMTKWFKTSPRLSKFRMSKLWKNWRDKLIMIIAFKIGSVQYFYRNVWSGREFRIAWAVFGMIRGWRTTQKK